MIKTQKSSKYNKNIYLFVNKAGGDEMVMKHGKGKFIKKKRPSDVHRNDLF